MKSKDEFLERFRRHLAGMALFGTVSELRDGPIVRAAKILDIPAEVERLLEQMYDYVTETKLPVNGQAATTNQRKAPP